MRVLSCLHYVLFRIQNLCDHARRGVTVLMSLTAYDSRDYASQVFDALYFESIFKMTEIVWFFKPVQPAPSDCNQAGEQRIGVWGAGRASFFEHCCFASAFEFLLTLHGLLLSGDSVSQLVLLERACWLFPSVVGRQWSFWRVGGGLDFGGVLELEWD
ncbi:hypothetical protein Tco_0573860 [Tanacetum coccineum]